jgi:hypothetical protein
MRCHAVDCEPAAVEARFAFEDTVHPLIVAEWLSKAAAMIRANEAKAMKGKR